MPAHPLRTTSPTATDGTWRHERMPHPPRTTSPTATDVLIAQSWGYTLDSYSAFIVSLRRTGFGGDIKIIGPLGALKPGVAALCHQWRADLIDTVVTSLATRFVLYADECRGYQRCLAADFRDVFFQANPFDHLPPPGLMADLILSLEPWDIGGCRLGQHELIRSCFNARTLQTCFGAKALREVRNYTVICSGVLMGTPAGFRALADGLMPLTSRCPGQAAVGYDQASLNYLIYGGANAAGTAFTDGLKRGQLLRRQPVGSSMLQVELQLRGTGVVNTVGLLTSAVRAARLFEQQHMSADGFVLNDDGAVAPMVHQYDRLLKALGKAENASNRYIRRFRAIDEAIIAGRASVSESLPLPGAISDEWVGEWGGG